jgi:hypothetical protein
MVKCVLHPGQMEISNIIGVCRREKRVTAMLQDLRLLADFVLEVVNHVIELPSSHLQPAQTSSVSSTHHVTFLLPTM